MSDLTIFSQFVDDMPLRNITVKTIDQFVQMQSEQGLQPATINRRLSAIASFFAYVIVESEDDTWRSPVHGQRHRIRMGEHLSRDVADNTVAALLAVVEDTRDRAMIWLMVAAGLRIGEVVNLTLSDLDPTETTHLARLRVRGKGQKERVVWLTHEVLLQVQAWLAERPSSESDHLFLN